MLSISRVCLTGRCDPSTVRMISSYSDAGYSFHVFPKYLSCFSSQQFSTVRSATFPLGPSTPSTASSPLATRPFVLCHRTSGVSQLLGILSTNWNNGSPQYPSVGKAQKCIPRLEDPPKQCGSFLSRISLADIAPDVLVQLVGGTLRCPWLLCHLDLLINKMEQKTYVFQILKSAQQALTADSLRNRIAQRVIRDWKDLLHNR